MKIVVHLTESEGERALHSAFMAIGLATALRGKGAEVALMLDSEAPNLAKKTWANKSLAPMPGMKAMGKMPPKRLGDVLAGFVKAGGRILMCPHCSAVCGASMDAIVTGAKHAEEGGLAKLVFEADKIVDY
jgi:predicted peroxiredoxin